MSASRPDGPPGDVAGAALRLPAKLAAVTDFARPQPWRFRRARPDDVVVAVAAAGVNQSDAKAALGAMPQAVWPRTPGRDFAGTVIDGPTALVGRAVFGTGGDLGIRRDGSHASHLVLPAAAVVRTPEALAVDDAGAIGVPFVTALLGFRRAGMPSPGETVVVFGANGKVGQAATQIATARGARVVAVSRGEGYVGRASGPLDFVDGTATDGLAARILALSDGRGGDIVLNAVGSPYFEAAQEVLAPDGRHIVLASIAPVVSLRLFDFYHARHALFGIDSLALDASDCARMLEELAPDFASGRLRGFAASMAFPLSQAGAAYAAALAGRHERIILVPDES